MFCQNCGTQLIQGSKFCSKCGAPSVIESSNSLVSASNKQQGVFGFLFGNKIKFLPIWFRSTIILTILMVVIFGIAGSFTDGFGDAFIGIIVLAAMISVLVTFFILWKKRGYIFDEPLTTSSYLDDDTKFKGLGGWLIVVILGLFYNAGILIYQAYGDISQFANGTVDKVSDPNFSNYVPGYNGMITFETIVSTLLVLFAIYLIILFFMTKKEFPKYYIIFLIAAFVFLIVDYSILQGFPDQVKSLISDTIDKQTGAIGQSVISSAIWISYMLKSKRVKATFIN